jgi:hypothetical protein
MEGEPRSTPNDERRGSVSGGATTSATAQEAEVRAAIDQAPGAVPPTEGVPPKEGVGGAAPRSESSAIEDLADGLDLMVRAARKAMRSVDPRIEETADRALRQLRELDAVALHEIGKVTGVDPKKIEQAADEAGREIARVVDTVAQRIDALFPRKRE